MLADGDIEGDSEDEGDTDADGDCDGDSEEDGETDVDGLIEADGETLADSEDDGETEAEGLTDGLSDDDGDTDAEGDTEGDSEEEGLTDADGDTDGLSEEDGLTEADGDCDGDSDEDGERDGDTDEEPSDNMKLLVSDHAPNRPPPLGSVPATRQYHVEGVVKRSSCTVNVTAWPEANGSVLSGVPEKPASVPEILENRAVWTFATTKSKSVVESAVHEDV
jgi:hypothetical protein